MNLPTLVAAAASICFALQQADTPIVATPVILQVADDGGPCEAEVKVTVEGLPDEIADKPIAWAPRGQQEPMTAIGNPDLHVALGRKADREACVSFEFSRGHLSAGRSQILHLRVENAKSIAPGIYEGMLRAVMQSILVPGVEVPVQWPIVLVVPGRRIERLEHVNAPAHVGADASVAFDVVTVGQSIGEGALDVDISPPAGVGAKKSLLRIPLPLSGVVNTATDLSAEKNALCSRAACDTPWQMALIHTEVAESVAVESSPYLPDQQAVRHRVHVGLPPWFDLGTAETRVRWQRDASGSVAVEARCGSQVAAGIWVTPRPAIRNEELTVDVVSAKDLGNKISLMASVGGEEQTLTLVPERNVSGSYHYRTKFRPIRVGTYAFSAPATLIRDLPQPAEVPVVLQARSQLNQAIVVVRSQAPWWGFLKDPGSAGPTAQRRDALVLYGLAAGTDRAVLSVSCVLVQAPSGEYVPLTAEVQPHVPRVALVPHGAKEEGAAAPEGKAAGPAEWVLTPGDDNGLQLDLHASIRTANGTLMEQVRMGSRRYRLLLHLAVARNGQTAHRLLHVPVRVDVLTGPEYYANYANWRPSAVGYLAIFCVVCGVLVWLVARRGSGASGTDEPERGDRKQDKVDSVWPTWAEETTEPSSRGSDEEQELAAGRSRARATESASARNASRKRSADEARGTPVAEGRAGTGSASVAAWDSGWPDMTSADDGQDGPGSDDTGQRHDLLNF